MHCHCLQTVPC